MARSQKSLARVPRSLQAQEATWFTAVRVSRPPLSILYRGGILIHFALPFSSFGLESHLRYSSLIMVRLREIPRTATFAWSPGAASPLIATGTRAGAVDVDFSNKTCLELWDLGLDRQDASEELQPVAKLDTDSG